MYKQKLTYLQILQYHQFEQNLDVLVRNQRGIWGNVEYSNITSMNTFNSLQTDKLSNFLLIKETKNKQTNKSNRECVTFIFDPLVKSLK